ncbi:hypothetical protein [Streptomyces sp. NPDC057002]|uniref:hypothetical protein n=1 Tax=Streptomyces sp. NPDC057002 TaxID=3345992 RepID=UPI00362EF91E
MEFNQDQFPQPGPGQRAFRGFGDQAMRHHRVTPPTPEPTAPQQPDTPSGWTQPELPNPPVGSRPAGTGRLSAAAQARADIRSANDSARAARVATAQARAQAAQHRQSLAESRAAAAQQRAAQATRTSTPAAPGPVPDLTPPTPPSAPAGPGRRADINSLAYRNTSLRFGPPPEPDEPAPSVVPPRPTTPPRPAAPPSSPGRTAGRVTPGMARAGRALGAGAVVGAKALQSINAIATDPKRSGNPAYKTNQGWMRS